MQNTRFHFERLALATLAQQVEHLTCNEDAVSSILTGGSSEER